MIALNSLELSGVMKGTNMNQNHFTFTYDYFSYMIKYKGKNIGGASTLNRSGRKLKSNLEFYKQQAEVTIRDILAGRMRKDMRDSIRKIDRESK